MLPSGATPGTTDRFTVLAGAEDVVLLQRPQVERIFRVQLSVLEKTCLGSPHIWLQLEGPQENVRRAKEYLKGLCNPEVWEEVSYPAALHCVFFGAGGLFLDYLCWATSAHMVPQAPGSLLLGGLIEAFVMAQSRVEDLSGKLRQGGPQGTQSRNAREQVTQAFKALVGSYGDEHSRALLALPVSVQEWLLNLAGESGRGQGLPESPLGQEGSPVLFESGGWGDPVRTTPSEGREVREGDIVSLGTRSVDQEGMRVGCLPSDPGERDWEKLWFMGEMDSRRTGELVREKGGHTQNLSGQRNLERPGSPREGLHRQRIGGREGVPEERDCPSRERNWGKDGLLGERDWNGEDLTRGRDWGRELHFGQRDCGKGGPSREEDQDRVRCLEGKCLKREELSGEVSQREGPQNQDQFPSPDFLQGLKQAASDACGHSSRAMVGEPQWRGPLMPHLHLNNGESSPPMGPNLLPGAQSTWLESPKPGDGQSVGLLGQEPPKGSVSGPIGGSSEVTKTQRFLEALKTPFSLNLTNVPGATGLRHVIIDGSNIAMIHGLQHFFSCRGIALAVQYFWDRGHREITVFVPQWRLRKDSKVKERHFLTKLQSLSLLSVTPSRIVEGKRITSYDDRFMVKLAEETDGIIVSNDQFRDLSNESEKWAEIIREWMQTSRGRSTRRRGLPASRPSRPSSRARSQVRSGAHPRPPPRPRSQPRPHTRGLTESEFQPKQLEKTEEDVGMSGLRRSRETEQLRHKLLEVFWGQDHKVDFILQRNPSNRDLNQLSEALLSLNF
ncbi:protein KHNYN isoform X2 [Dromiciops gliroides]|uniref:protein KHNYN isoform X2 n=1 Tax=Dromiciops gliroides TaxID=33562 RepID=UPI001CC51BB0|nr:protein KHNYN isoform X2 [Dromiciops gliroides]